ncbi:MAG: 4a-hydroxytetrahydrobiopterin dehydratase [Anaerolineae bacterium]|nr:4a-hydroxytetrahydrobiopterin dehydratase [Anaerolineae bacterium]NUQ06400.1 4a-hydroxytetrahydrobiopterin dehydratase [Anaerolineae bacterium]
MAHTPLTDEQIAESLETLPGWTRQGETLTRTYALPSYMAGLAFACAVGTVCEGLDHHPDLFIGWKKVTVSFTTHDAGSRITEWDVKAARAVDTLGYPNA